MIHRLLELRKQEGACRIVFVYEASGQGFGLYDELRDAGIECHVLAPTHLPKTPGRKRNKTDERDALMLLEQCRGYVLAGNLLPTVWIPPATLRDDRDLVRSRLETAEASTQVKLQTYALLKRNRIALPAFFLKHRHWTKRFIGWLEETAQGMRSGAAEVVRIYVARYREFHRELLALDGAIRRLSQCDRYQLACQWLQKIPGVGQLTAMVFLTEMGDLNRFQNRRQVAAYLGLCPSSFESGERNDRKGHITRQGPSRVRKVLCQAAWAGVWKDEASRRQWERIRRGDPKRGKKAIVAVMRRLAIRMWHKASFAGVDESLVSPADPSLCSSSTRGGPPLPDFAVASVPACG
jgi:transposase